MVSPKLVFIISSKILQDRFLTIDRAEEIKRWIHQLSNEDRKNIIKAASWIRMSDVDRPIGAGLRNSAGLPFYVNPRTKEIFIESSNMRIPISQNQYPHIYGQAMMDNVKIIPDARSGFIAEFKLRLKNKEGENVSNELNQIPILKWVQEGTVLTNAANYQTESHVKSLLNTMVSLIADFPPGSFSCIRITY